jgi:hypothetical protein
MGENWKELGYESVFDFEKQMQTSESLQLEAFIRFIEWKTGTVGGKKVSLLEALRAEDWTAVFTLYNGPNYKNSVTKPSSKKNGITLSRFMEQSKSHDATDFTSPISKATHIVIYMCGFGADIQICTQVSTKNWCTGASAE